jgi:hypothetical protein
MDGVSSHGMIILKQSPQRGMAESKKYYREGAQRDLCPQPKDFYREGAKGAKLREGQIQILFFSSRDFASFAPSR